MDYTFLFIIILMLFAVKYNLLLVAGGLFVLLIFSTKSKYLLLASVIGLVIAALTKYIDLGDYTTYVVLGGLFAVMVLISRKDADAPQSQGFGPPGMGGMY